MAAVYSKAEAHMGSTNSKPDEQILTDSNAIHDAIRTRPLDVSYGDRPRHLRRRRPRTFGDVDHYKAGAGSISDFGGSFKGNF